MATRYYTALAQSGTAYVLPSDENERNRLNLQHQRFKDLFGHELLPKSLVLEQDDKILDAGTGTGAWALDVAGTVPAGVTVHGFDIESRLLPANPPLNAHFSVHSAVSLPTAWRSSFILVHQRLLMGALPLPSWKQALASYFQVLKPGGYLLLYEPRKGIARLLNKASDAAGTSYTERFDEIFKPLAASRGLLPDCGERLPSLLTEAGFVDIHQEVKAGHCGPGDATKDWRKTTMEGYRGVKVPVLKSGGFGIVNSEDEWEELMSNIEGEWEQNSVVIDFVRITARKPM